MKITNVEALRPEIGGSLQQPGRRRRAAWAHLHGPGEGLHRCRHHRLLRHGNVGAGGEGLRRCAEVERRARHGMLRGLASLLIGENPLEVERLWYRMYRGSIYYGRRGVAMQAISAIDIALWDICGKPTGSRSTCCSAASGATKCAPTAARCSAPRPRPCAKPSTVYIDQGFTAVKFGWGVFGKDFNRDVQLVEAAREALGRQSRSAGRYRMVRGANAQGGDPGGAGDRAVPPVSCGRAAASGGLRRLPAGIGGGRYAHRVRRAGGDRMGLSSS